MAREITVPPGSKVTVRRKSQTREYPDWRRRPPLESPPRDGIPFRNDSGETCPAYGVLRVTGGVIVESKQIVTCGKPNTTLSRLYLVNGPIDVADGDGGLAFQYVPRLVLYDTGTPAYGEGWGPKPSQWSISKGFYGFTILGNHASGSVFAVNSEVNALIGKTNAAHAKGASGTVNIYAGTKGSEAIITSMTVSAYNRYADLATGVWVDLTWKGNGWDEVAAEC